ncbi:MAG: recombination protein RecR [Gammaproteobacteria bacterium]|nr:recombination protein RecR [Gammaproteobacteria bacterium]
MSQVLDNLVGALQLLPGVGRKSAQRMALNLIQHKRDAAEHLIASLRRALDDIQHCAQCRNLTEAALCEICSDPQREDAVVCVVEDPSDQLAIERATQFKGRYFVLHGRISPLDGVGPQDIGVDVLEGRLSEGGIKTLILATGGTVEGLTTAEYIAAMAERYQVEVQRLAQGLPVGSELDYIDPATLSMAFNSRR